MNKKEKILEKIIELKKEIKEDPTNSKLYVKLAKKYLKSEDYKLREEAYKTYKKAFKLSKSSDIALKIANLYLSDENRAYAYKYFLKAIKLSPQDQEIILKAKECAFEYYLEDYVEDAEEKELRKKLIKYTS
ncbi:MAG: hypothetical protein HWD90_02610 [Campylobacteraceae bacterium]|nr:hypothetical protein [Campylobacteraceae bacterium]